MARFMAGRALLGGAVFLWAVIGCLTGVARADTIEVDPSNYRAALGTLAPGDVLSLAPGTYTRLTLQDLQGTPDAWITVRGPSDGAPAVVVGESGYNTVQLYGCAYVAIENLVVDVQGLYVDAINAKDSVSHHIRVEGCTLRGFPNDQQIVGISTKSTAWGWTIRHNWIEEAGTGMYLGNSDGSAPFVDGVIEENVVLNPIGYCIQVKHQNNYSLMAGMPEGPSSTLIRHNVLIKDDRPSTSGDRPNLLVGGFPDSGPGSQDLYEIYGNFIYHNPRESLFQGAGRMSIHDNLLVGAGAGAGQAALLLTSHQGKDVRVAHVYNNTVYGVATGIQITSAPAESGAVVANLVFADDPIRGSTADVRDNIVDAVSEAGSYVNAPSTELGSMDFYPLAGAVTGPAASLALFSGDVDHDRDFNGDSKGDFRFRGAYAGEGDNPGWVPAADFKAAPEPGSRPDGGVPGPDAGTPDAGSSGDAATGGDAGSRRDGASRDDGGTRGDGGTGSSGGGCHVGARQPGGALWLLVLAALALWRRRR